MSDPISEQRGRGPCSARHRVLAWLLLAAAAALVLSGCGRLARPAATARPATSVPATTGSSGCGTAPRSAGELAMTIDGHRRTVSVHLPSGYAGSDRLPLVLNMHGSGSTAAGQEAFSGMDATADADQFIVAYPQALIPAGSGFDWNVPGVPLVGGAPVPKNAANDVTFLTTLVAVLEHRYCVDPARVYATGFSGGARMASQLGCDASDTFAAIAPVSGLRLPAPCPAVRAVPVIAFHGTADPIDPYQGHGQVYWTYSVPHAAQLWAGQDRCSAAATSHSGPGFARTEYSGCADGSAVELYSLTGEGHEWPGGPRMPRVLTRLLGPQSTAVDADALIWAFFAAHPMPG